MYLLWFHALSRTLDFQLLNQDGFPDLPRFQYARIFLQRNDL